MGFLVSSLLCNLVGFAYPTYASFKAIESQDCDDDTNWLIYWVVYSIFSIFECVADTFVSWVPLYYEFKLIALLSLQVPQLKLAATLYQLWIRPFFAKHQNKLDTMIDDASKQLKEKATEVAFAEMKKGL